MAVTKGKVPVSANLERNSDWMSQELGIDRSFDVIRRDISIGDRKAALFFVDGFAKDEIMERILTTFAMLQPQDLRPTPLKQVFHRYLSYIEVETTDDLHDAVSKVLAGPLALVIDGIPEIIIIDAREYPVRGPQEPDLEKVVRGSRDGFVETVVFNTALIRRRIRDPKLRMEMMQVGRRSKTDVCISYIEDIANDKLVQMVKDKINQIDIDGIPMAEKSVEELIAPGSFWNPLPRVRYSERPDVAAAHLLEGHVLIIVDTSPSVIILPSTLWHHLQHAEEFRQSLGVGIFIRLLRFAAVFLSVFLMPLWLLLATNPRFLPESLAFIGAAEPGSISLPIQFILAELGINLMRMAAIHTPASLTTALGLIAAVLIGDIAISVGLFSPEVVLYTAIAAVAIFATPSSELGQANTLFRLFLIVSVAVLGLPGFVGAVFLILLLLIGTKSFGVPYLWPLIPFNLKSFKDILIRPPVPTQNLRPFAGPSKDYKRQATPGRAAAKPEPEKVGMKQENEPASRRKRRERRKIW
ncbi:MAG: spore germination protein [Bacillota bacterium]|jgi:stage V sporulation protein AF